MGGFNFIKCSICGNPFNSNGGKVCPKCLDEADDAFIKVRDYLYDHPGAAASEISEETEVPEKMILHLINEGRLEIEGVENTGPRCSVCGKAIRSGSMCETCKAEVARSLMSTVPKPERAPEKPLLSEKDKSKMHTDFRNRGR